MLENVDLLLIEDNDDHAEAVKKCLVRSKNIKFLATRKRDLNSALIYMSDASQKVDLVLLGLSSSSSTCADGLRVVAKQRSNTPIICLSSFGGHELAQIMIRNGAQDYLCRSELNSDLITRTIVNALERFKTHKKICKQVDLSKALSEIGQMALLMEDSQKLLSASLSLLGKKLNASYYELLECRETHLDYIAGNTVRKIYEGMNIFDDKIMEFCINNFIHQKCDVPYEFNRSDSKVKNILHKQMMSLKVSCGVCLVLPFGFEGQGIVRLFFSMPYSLDDDEKYFIQSAAKILAASVLKNKLEQRLNSQIEVLNEDHKRKDEFFAIISHELRNPLNVIVGYTEFLKQPNRSESEFQNAIDTIQSSAHLESQLVSEILDVSRIISGKFSFDPDIICLDELIDSTITSFGISAEKKKICLEKKIEGKSLGVLYADEYRLKQVLWNLLSNALKFTPEEGQIIIGGCRLKSAVQLFIQDNGCGIESDHLPKVFEKFWQANTSFNKTYSGMGLGLSIAKHIIELHGGEIRVESEGKNKGTTFTFCLPVYDMSLHI